MKKISLFSPLKVFSLLVLFAINCNSQTGTALNFSGTTNYCQRPVFSTLTTSLTVEARVLLTTTSTANQYIYCNGNGGSAGYGMFVSANSQSVTIIYGGVAAYTTTYTIPTNTMTLLSMVKSGTTLRLYANGTLAYSITAGTPAAPSGSFVVGCNGLSSPGEMFNGSIDEVRFWNRDLCATEIAFRATCSANGTDPGMLALYKFNQGTGSAANATINVAYDEVSATNNFTLNAFSLTGGFSNWLTLASSYSTTCLAAPTLTNVTITGPGTLAVCMGKTITLTANGITTGTWNGGPTTLTYAVSPTINTTYSFVGGPDSQTGCYALAQGQVTVNALPTVTALASTGSLCSGSTATLTGAGTSTGYVWTNSCNITVSNGAAFFPGTSCTYTCTGTAANSCSAATTTSILVVTLPNNPPTTSPAFACLGGSICLICTSGAANVTWTPGGSNSPTLCSTPTATGVTVYTLTQANSNCVDIKTINLIVNPLPAPVVIPNPTNTVCSGKSTTLIGSGGSTYTWSPSSPVITNYSISVAPTTTTTYSFAASDGSCINTATFTVFTKPNPTITIGATSTVICAGQTVGLTASGAQTYTWVPSTLSGTYNVVSPPSATVYIVTGTSSVACTSSVSQVINVNPIPALSVGPKLSTGGCVCIGGATQLTVTGANTYTWLTGTPPSNLTPTITVNPTTTTTYSVIGKFTLTGCTNTITQQVSIFDPTFAVTGPTSSCIGGTITLTANNPSGVITPTFSWLGNPNPFGGAVLITSPPTATTYVCIIAGTSLNCLGTCTRSQSYPIAIYPNPTVVPIATPTKICLNEKTALSATGALTYSWTAINTGTYPGYNATGSVVSFFGNPQANYVMVIGTDLHGCNDTEFVYVLVSYCTGIDKAKNISHTIKIYPNPSNGILNIKAEAQLSLKLLNEVGQLVRTIELDAGNNFQVSVANLPEGIYFIEGANGLEGIRQKVLILKN